MTATLPHVAHVAHVMLFASLLSGCPDPPKRTTSEEPEQEPGATELPAVSATASASAPEATKEDKPVPPCPPEMVLIPAEKSYCIDRWEAVLEDRKTGKRLSPYYSPVPKHARSVRKTWESKRGQAGSAEARAMPLPPLPDWQLAEDVVPIAVSRPGEIPQGYLTGLAARAACENAGKRLCSRDEWVHACRGAADQPFPYGETYQKGTCNIFRYTHPAAALHDDPSTGHLDPRLNLVKDKQGPLLRLTGETKSCASRWGNDAVYDMVGNLDEWIDDEDGVFVGGFFSRSKRDGCASVVKNHPINYWDYSLGVRCCRAATFRN